MIQQGAKLVQKTEEILLELQPQLKQQLRKKEDSKTRSSNSGRLGRDQIILSETQKKVLESMGYDPVDIDTLVERCQLPVQTVSVALLALEVENHVGEDNGFYTRIK